MSYHSTQPGLFDPAQGSLPIAPAQPATEKQISYAKALAAKTGKALPQAVMRDKAMLSAWIDSAKPPKPEGRFSDYPSAKQVQFAERIARLKRRDIPQMCFKDRTLMSRWIDGNKPR
ncbi:hypothetical protein [uncultured Tateyamaria sp.]|uniref:hypothetical protein n=1 Tax=Tateyamaria sp. 1078 TaxID=3417464 RepID=UPI002630A8B2|nr:hypothetical protein [uncultured Tateyamaria sp.]